MNNGEPVGWVFRFSQAHDSNGTALMMDDCSIASIAYLITIDVFRLVDQLLNE